MTDFENLKRSYALTMQVVLATKSGYLAAMHDNELLHKLCENLVKNSFYSDQEKTSMKLDLHLLKEAFSKEIKHVYNNG